MSRGFLALGGLLLFLAGCGRPDNPGEIRAAAQKPLTPQSRRVAFSLDDFVGSYAKFGSHNEKWNSSATNGLACLARARVTTGAEESTLRSTAYNEIQRAIEAGCDEPLVVYAWAWLRYPDAMRADETSKNEWVRAADMMRTTPYSPVRRYWAIVKAAQASKAVTKETPPEVHSLRQEAFSLVQQIVDDKNIPVEEVTQAVSTLFETVRRNKHYLHEYYDALETSFFKNWAQSPHTWFIKGDLEIDFAWESRGNGWANTVTRDGWKGMKDHLAIAEKALEKSWQIRPDEKTAVRLITVELGQGKGRERMEKNFRRAMILNPNSFDACSAKMNYLYPKWYGSIEEVMRFGWECIGSTNWSGTVPLVMVDAHDELAREFYPKAEERDQYWLDPAVWPGIDAAYKKFFKVYPDANGWHHNYFYYAVKCEQWKTANEQLAQLGPVNYSYFGGKEKFEAMADKVRQHAGERKGRNDSADAR